MIFNQILMLQIALLKYNPLFKIFHNIFDTGDSQNKITCVVAEDAFVKIQLIDDVSDLLQLEIKSRTIYADSIIEKTLYHGTVFENVDQYIDLFSHVIPWYKGLNTDLYCAKVMQEKHMFYDIINQEKDIESLRESAKSFILTFDKVLSSYNQIIKIKNPLHNEKKN